MQKMDDSILLSILTNLAVMVIIDAAHIALYLLGKIRKNMLYFIISCVMFSYLITFLMIVGGMSVGFCRFIVQLLSGVAGGALYYTFIYPHLLRHGKI